MKTVNRRVSRDKSRITNRHQRGSWNTKGLSLTQTVRRFLRIYCRVLSLNRHKFTYLPYHSPKGGSTLYGVCESFIGLRTPSPTARHPSHPCHTPVPSTPHTLHQTLDVTGFVSVLRVLQRRCLCRRNENHKGLIRPPKEQSTNQPTNHISTFLWLLIYTQYRLTHTPKGSIWDVIFRNPLLTVEKTYSVIFFFSLVPLLDRTLH